MIENGCAAFCGEFNVTATGIGNEANRVAFRDDISRTTQMFLDEFVGGEMSAMYRRSAPLVRSAGGTQR